MSNMRDIIGNETIKEHFMSAISQKKVSHAYILEGEKGSGKKILSAAFAKILQCESQNACDICESCIQMEHKDHPDVIWLRHEKPNVISVNEVREQIVNTIDIMPYKGPYKIYIVDEAEKMNAAAQNAILKTIEEPPDYAVILLLTTNRGAFLSTILSRCILLNVKPVSDIQIKEYLEEKLKMSGDAVDFAIGFSMGNIGKAVSITSSEEFLEIRDFMIDLLKYIHETNSYVFSSRVKEIKKHKDNYQDYLDLILMWFRDVLLYKTVEADKKIIFKNEYNYIRKQADLLNFNEINDIIDEVYKTRNRIRSNVNFDTSFELLFLQIRRTFNK